VFTWNKEAKMVMVTYVRKKVYQDDPIVTRNITLNNIYSTI